MHPRNASTPPGPSDRPRRGSSKKAKSGPDKPNFSRQPKRLISRSHRSPCLAFKLSPTSPFSSPSNPSSHPSTPSKPHLYRSPQPPRPAVIPHSSTGPTTRKVCRTRPKSQPQKRICTPFRLLLIIPMTCLSHRTSTEPMPASHGSKAPPTPKTHLSRAHFAPRNTVPLKAVPGNHRHCQPTKTRLLSSRKGQKVDHKAPRPRSSINSHIHHSALPTPRFFAIPVPPGSPKPQDTKAKTTKFRPPEPPSTGPSKPNSRPHPTPKEPIPCPK